MKNRRLSVIAIIVVLAGICGGCGDRSMKYVFDADQARLMAKYDQAEKLYLKAIEANPQNAMAYNNYGILLQVTKRYNKSLTNLQKARELFKDKKNQAIAENNMGLNYDLQSKYDNAIPHYKKAISLDPNYYESYSNLGSVYLAQGKYDEAIKTFIKTMRVIEVSKVANKPRAIVNTTQFLVLSYIKKKDYRNALQLLDGLIKMNPFNEMNHSFLGDVYRNTKEFDKAEKSYEKALSLNKSALNALVGLALVKAHKKDFKNALELIEQAKSVNPEASIVTISEGKVRQMQGQPDKAKKIWQEALKKDPKNEELKALLGATEK